MILNVVSSILLIIAIAALMDLTPEQLTDDLMELITPNETLHDKARNLRGNRKRHRLYKRLVRLKGALTTTGKSRQFTIAFTASLILFGVGIIISLLINNLFLAPVLSVALSLIPFLYVSNSLSYYEKQTKEELETALSIITTSYERCDDIVQAVRENTGYIKPPLRKLFLAFEGEATVVTSNIKTALYNMKEKLDNDVFREWVDTLILCQDDRTLKDTLHPVVQKLADIRIVNSELATMLTSVRNEYWMMVALVIGNIPLLYLINRDWFETLIYSLPGKAVCGLCGVVILVTAYYMKKFTKPIEYKR
ncbi:MAG: hypothetical protein SO122_04785 [Eubacteriales bacterium]|nr:hypothetical protein [Eubacteriales bacterium]